VSAKALFTPANNGIFPDAINCEAMADVRAEAVEIGHNRRVNHPLISQVWPYHNSYDYHNDKPSALSGQKKEKAAIFFHFIAFPVPQYIGGETPAAHSRVPTFGPLENIYVPGSIHGLAGDK
jgi:hypothetical protein